MAPAKKGNANTWLMDRHPLYANRLFDRYGQLIGQHPIWFLVIPVVIALGFCPGVMQLKRLDNGDTMMWMMPRNMARRLNDPIIKTWFRTLDTVCSCDNSTEDIDCSKIVPPACKGGVENTQDMLGCNRLQILTFAKNGKSVTEVDLMADLIRLDTFISLTFNAAPRGSKPIMFSDVDNPTNSVCQRRSDGTCIQFSMLTAVRQQISKLPGLSTSQAQDKFLLEMVGPEKEDDFNAMLSSQGGSRKFSYPFDSTGMFIAPLYGRVKYMRANETWQQGFRSGQTRSMGAMQMFYCFNSTKESQSALFTRQLAAKLKSMYRSNKNLQVVTASSWSAGEANNRAIIEVGIRFIICFVATLIFVFAASYITGGARTGKPWFAVIGVVFQLMTIVAAFGFLGWIGFSIVDFSISAALLVFALGIGDVFEMLTHWSSTDASMTVPQRLGAVLRTTAVSIITTAVMNILSFAIDVGMANATAIRVYSTVTTVTLTFQLVMNLTALPACLALFGYLEPKGNHSCCCCAKLSQFHGYMPTLSGMCCAENSTKEEDALIWYIFRRKFSHNFGPESMPVWNSKFSIIRAIRKEFFYHIQKAPFPICILVSFLIYVGICGYLCSRIEVGMKAQNLAPAERDGPNGLEAYVTNFRTFSFQIEVILKGVDGETIQYWDDSVRQQILGDLMSDLHQVKNIAPAALSRCWLRDFVNYTNVFGLDISNKENFFTTLRDKFFRQKNIDRLLFLDVGFDETGTTIEASRFIIMAVNSIDVTTSGKIIDALRLVALKYVPFGIDVKFYCNDFDLVEPMMGITFITVWCILVHLTVISVASQVAWVRPMPTFLVSFVTVSVWLGIIALTLAWNVQLDPISCFGILSSLSMAINFPVKLTSAFVDADSQPTSPRFQQCATNIILGSVQSTVASMLSIIALATSPIYLVATYFKFYFIALLLGSYHTILVLILMIFHLRIKK